MLSIVDLIEAGTFTRDLAAYALAAIGGGASFMVGARPGGAGKTTVMGALLNCVPGGVDLIAADSVQTIRKGLSGGDRRCYICHEIGAGPYYAYLWGEALRRYFDLPDAGHMLATNLHADTCDEARDQVCGENGVSRAAFRRMQLLFFLRVSGYGPGAKRIVSQVWESDGQAEHGRLSAPEASQIVSGQALALAREQIEDLLDAGRRRIQDVRESILESRAGGLR